jgi:large subunit ribosomal protein L9
MDVALALAEAGQDIDRRRILLEAPIKRLGSYPVKIKLHPQVVVDVTVVVEAQAGDSPAGAETQAEELPAEE